MELLKPLREYAEAFWKLIFPPRCTCIFCKEGYLLNSYGICRGCHDKITFIGKGRWIQTSEIKEGISCRMFSVVEYQGEVRKLIYRLKYSNETYLAREMATMMVDFIYREGLRGDCLLPIPLYKPKEKERGFNQANLLTKYISKEAGIPNINNNLIRNRNTKAMHHLSKRQRRDNVKGAFTLKNPNALFGKNILLVDDILTTGSTVEACIRLLLEAGVATVTVLTFARVTKGREDDRLLLEDDGVIDEMIISN
ncbi:ComF family protein [Alkaliphilus transvaalensis]|uniref:ComF family protein n=1 Tax=Alkaliphilus transvaalensis TaxID=114628 RepID=UPI00068700F7|nr:ComF family protein [Alkaliphilus transvaalensis]